MIVKNESPVIVRCLNSLRGFIDAWVIVDTGSTDGTQEIIRSHLSELPGELYERPWKNFAHNRSEALELARGKADYVFIIDADEVLEFERNYTIPVLEADAYHFVIESGGCSYFKTQLVNNRLTWSFKNVLHEYIHSEEPATEAVLPGVKTLRFPDGARARDPRTYHKDAEILQQALQEEPDNTRYLFYLAQSYRDAHEYELAIKYYQQRADAGGWDEEVWYSLFQVAHIKQRMEAPWPEVLAAYLAAYQYKPNRVEPLYFAGIYYQGKREYHTAYLFLQQAVKISYPVNDRLFIDKRLYDYLIQLEYAVCAYYVGRHDEVISINNRLLQSGKLPPELIELIIDNRRFSLNVINKPLASPRTLPHICVLVPFRQPSHALDNLVETLLYQSYEHCSFWFIDDGSEEDNEGRIATEDKRFRYYRHETTAGWSERIRGYIDELSDDVIVLPLFDHCWLAETDSLQQLANQFAGFDCQLVYGQYRLASGHIGQAEPLPAPCHDATDITQWEKVFPLAATAALMKRVESFNNYHTLAGRLLAASPYHQQHFCDRPLVIVENNQPLYPNQLPTHRDNRVVNKILQ